MAELHRRLRRPSSLSDGEAYSWRLGGVPVPETIVDDQLVNAVTEGIDAVVILGAGYDTRA